MTGTKRSKRSISELWEDFQGTRLQSVHLDSFRAAVMEYCYSAGVRDFLLECDRIGREQPQNSAAVGAYIQRCLREVEELDFKMRPRMTNGRIPGVLHGTEPEA